MTYSLTIIRDDNSNARDVEFINGIKTWPEVTNFLRKKLDQWTKKVHIYKYSSDNKLLGERAVTMANICEVAFALRDKEVLL